MYELLRRKSPEIWLVPNDVKYCHQVQGPDFSLLWLSWCSPHPQFHTVTASSSRLFPLCWQNIHGNSYPQSSSSRKRRELLCQDHLWMKKETSFSQKPQGGGGVSFTSRGPGSFICQFLNPSLPIATAEGGVSSTQTLRQWGRAVSSNESSGPASRLEGYKVVGSKPRSLQELWEVDSREESTKEEVVGVPG